MLGIDYVRVRDKSLPDGRTFTVVRAAAEAEPDAYEILDEDAVDHNDQPLPPTFGDVEQGYGGFTVTALKDEIARRNEDRDEHNQIPAQGNKPDLIAALEADDNKE